MRFYSIAAIGLVMSSPSLASETVTYTYDSLGRLVRVVRTGSVNNGQQVNYDHDKADNRVRVTVTGTGR